MMISHPWPGYNGTLHEEILESAVTDKECSVSKPLIAIRFNVHNLLRGDRGRHSFEYIFRQVHNANNGVPISPGSYFQNPIVSSLCVEASSDFIDLMLPINHLFLRNRMA